MSSREEPPAPLEGEPGLFDFLIDGAEELLALLDIEGRVVDANESFCRLFRLTRTEIRGRSARELLAGAGGGEAAAEALERAARGERSSYVVRLGGPPGPERILEFGWTPYRGQGPAGSPVRHVALLGRDIGPFVEAQRELLEEKRRAEEASRAKNDILAVLSHELRTPLNAVIGLLDLALRGDGEEELREDLLLALDSSHRLLGIVDDILDLAGIESGRFALELVDFDPAERAQAILRSFEAAASRKGLSLRFEKAEGLPKALSGDPLRYGQILANLLDNAIKFTERGEVALRLFALEELEGRPGLRLEVSDSGIGIAAEKLELIFEDFVQAEAGMARRFGGAGLGLAVVRKLVELLGGRVSVESRPGLGSLFRVELRFEPGDPAALRPPSLEPLVRAPRSLRVLLVEDDRVNALVGRRYLEKAGHRPGLACSGEEALELLASEAFDLVLMDIQMPGIDGFETCRRIRAGEAGPRAARTPVVAMTAHAEPLIEAELRASGMDAYLSKPVMPAALTTLVARFATGSAGGPAPYDLEATLERLGGDRELFEEIREAFLTDRGKKRGELAEALAASDHELLRRTAHSLRGQARNLGAEPLARAAEALEGAALSRRSRDYAGLAAALEEAYEELAAALEEGREAVGGDPR